MQNLPRRAEYLMEYFMHSVDVSDFSEAESEVVTARLEAQEGVIQNNDPQQHRHWIKPRAHLVFNITLSLPAPLCPAHAELHFWARRRAMSPELLLWLCGEWVGCSREVYFGAQYMRI